MTALLELRDLHVQYGHIRALEGLSLSVDAGETLALLGSNGAGKSTTLKAILGVVRPRQGDITLDGRSLVGKRPSDIVRLGIGYSPEGRRPFPRMSVYENLRVGGLGLDRARKQARMDRVLEYFPQLKARMTQLAGSLSGGEQQMLAIGRALMTGPKVFLLDEPSLGLAPIVTQRIGEILVEIQQREKVAVILAEQNAAWALRIAGRGAILKLGKLVREGQSRELWNDDQVKTAYLGA
jgi:branched-chain amino acid transport system ATP-binding protein